jgi:DNA-binding transcriptional MerR regulator
VRPERGLGFFDGKRSSVRPPRAGRTSGGLWRARVSRGRYATAHSGEGEVPGGLHRTPGGAPPPDPSGHTIGQLARAVGVPTSTLRYYERARILRPDGRTDGNYRLYGAAAVERLRFIRAAQATGFTLDDIARLLNFRDGATARCREVQGLIRDRLADLRKRLEQMRQVEAVLRSSLRMCRRFERTGRCRVIDGLKRAAASSPPKRARRRSSK